MNYKQEFNIHMAKLSSITSYYLYFLSKIIIRKHPLEDDAYAYPWETHKRNKSPTAKISGDNMLNGYSVGVI